MLALAALVLAIWTYLFFLHSAYWRLRELPEVESRTPARVAVLIPARNEAEYIAGSVRSILEQSFSGALRLFVIDDNSTDATREKADEAAAGDERFVLVSGVPLPQDWSGKVWALEQGWLAAKGWEPEWIWLTDSDVVHAPNTLARLHAQGDGGYDLASVMVRLHCKGLAERLLIPPFVYFLFMLYPPRAIEKKSSRVAGAAGGCVLLRSSLLEAIGGFTPLRSAIIDDCTLARYAKQQGGRLWLGVSRESVSLRPYDGFSGIGRMIARTAFSQLHHSLPLLLVCIVGMLVVYVLPVALVLIAHSTALALAAVSLFLMLASFVPISRYYGNSLVWVATLPVAAILYMGATVLSAFQFWMGKGGSWKGRFQDAG